MRDLLRLALPAVCLATVSGCYSVETYSRDLPPAEEAGPPPYRPPPGTPPPPPRQPQVPPQPAPGTGVFHVPPDRVPPQGLCGIWYDQLPPDRQPAPMTCARAHRVARNHGGRVIQAAGSAGQPGEVASTEYGPVDLRGVPPDQMPPPGYCRVWLDGVEPDRQPAPDQCPRAEREAQRYGARLLYMPSSDVR